MTTVPFLSDLTKIRVRTRAHSAEAAVAAGGVERRATVLQLLNDILASELIWLMRYRRRYLVGGGRFETQEEHASEEATPADQLARRIIELGGRPDLDPDHLLSRNRSDYASRGSVGDRIREDLRAERIVIESYAEVIGYVGATDPRTRAILEANLDRERARAAQLSEILHDLEVQRLEETG
jgi:bacterioferritin